MMWASRHPTCSVCNTYLAALHLHRNFGCCILQFSCLQVGLTLTSDRSCWWCWLLMPAARCQCCSGGRHSWVLSWEGSTLPGRAPWESPKWMRSGNLQILESSQYPQKLVYIRWLEAWLHDPQKATAVLLLRIEQIWLAETDVCSTVLYSVAVWKEGEHLHRIEISGSKSKIRWIWAPWLGLFSANWSIWNQIAGLCIICLLY